MTRCGREAPPHAAHRPAPWPAHTQGLPAAAASALLVVFRLGSQLYALPSPPVQRVVHAPALSRPPGLPPLMEGLLNLQGVAVPVLHAARLFGIPGITATLYTPLLIMTDGQRQIGLVVDEVCGMQVVADDELVAVADTELLNDCVIGDLPSATGLIHVLHPTRMLLEGERQRLIELQDLAQARLDALNDDGTA